MRDTESGTFLGTRRTQEAYDEGEYWPVLAIRLHRAFMAEALALEIKVELLYQTLSVKTDARSWSFHDWSIELLSMDVSRRRDESDMCS